MIKKIVDGFKARVNSLLGLFKKRREFKLGLYGPPNAGKTTLANKISMDFLGEEVGTVSNVPHETREIQMKENITIERKGKKMVINLIDTPGIATKIDFEDFLKFKLKKEDAKKRAKEATKGVIDAIKWLDRMDVVLAVMDSTKDPYTQVNITILGNLEARNIPTFVIANKVDSPKSNIEKIKAAFPKYKVIPISAKTGKGVDKLYDELAKMVK